MKENEEILLENVRIDALTILSKRTNKSIETIIDLISKHNYELTVHFSMLVQSLFKEYENRVLH